MILILGLFKNEKLFFCIEIDPYDSILKYVEGTHGSFPEKSFQHKLIQFLFKNSIITDTTLPDKDQHESDYGQLHLELTNSKEI